MLCRDSVLLTAAEVRNSNADNSKVSPASSKSSTHMRILCARAASDKFELDEYRHHVWKLSHARRLDKKGGASRIRPVGVKSHVVRATVRQPVQMSSAEHRLAGKADRNMSEKHSITLPEFWYGRWSCLDLGIAQG